MGKSNLNNQIINGTYIVDFNNTFRRNNRIPLDESSVIYSYHDAIDELSNTYSNQYKGQIVSILNGNDNSDPSEAVPYIIEQNPIDNNYKYERIMTLSYINNIFDDQDFVHGFELGYIRTGVGKWPNIAYDENTKTYITDYGEIFNDYENNTVGPMGHTEGINNTVYTDIEVVGTHIEGRGNRVGASYSHVEGQFNEVSPWAINSHVEGANNIVEGQNAHVEGYHNNVLGDYAHVEGVDNYGGGPYSHVGGQKSVSYGGYSFVHGYQSVSYIEGGVVFGSENAAGSPIDDKGRFSMAHGFSNNAIGDYSHAEGYGTISNGEFSHSEGSETSAHGIGSHAEGGFSTSVGDYSHAEGYDTQSSGHYSHAEGYESISIGNYSHAAGHSAESWGESSFSQGDHTQTYNNVEVAFGSYNKSYTGNDIGEYLQYCDIDMTKSGGTIFTIGNGSGKSDEEREPEDMPYRNNIYQIHENGDSLKSTGVSYYVHEVYAPVSFSYVESLGPSAYLTTILSALLTAPEYHRPSVSMQMNGTFSTSSTTQYLQYGSTFNQRIAFRSTYVVPNYNDKDPIYGTDLGNRLGYSTAITRVDYTYCYYTSDDPTNYDIAYASDFANYVPDTPSKTNNNTVNNIGERVDADIEGLTYTATLAKYTKDDLGLFNGAGITATSSTITIKDGFRPRSEGNYVIAYMTSYEYKGATKMYFQQLANKFTYISNDGIPPTNRYGDTSYVATNKITWNLAVRHAYYFGILASDDITTLNIYNGTAPTSSTAQGTIGWFGVQNFKDGHGHGVSFSATYPGSLAVSGSPRTFWVAVPSDGIFANEGNESVQSYDNMALEKITDDNTVRTWADANNIRCAARLDMQRADSYVQLNGTAGPGVLDTGITEKDAMSIKKIRSKTTVSSTGLHYDIYYINGTQPIGDGTVYFKLKRIW